MKKRAICAWFAWCLPLLLALGCIYNGGGTGSVNPFADDDAADDDASPDDDAADDDLSPDDDASPDDDTADDDLSPDDDDSAAPAPGIYALAGEDGNGPYVGFVELRKHNHGLSWTRIAEYSNLTFADPALNVDYRVFTVWTSDLVNMKAVASLQVADFVKSYNGLTRTDADGQPVAVNCTVAAARAGVYETTCANAPAASYGYSAHETWTYQSPPGDQPLFVADDTTVATHEPPPALIEDLFKLFFSSYWRLSYFDAYRARPEFKASVHYYRQFHTDFGWLRGQNPPAIRVVNKWLDDISELEAALRARAFSPTLAQKAAWFDADMPQYFLNPVGFYSAALIGSNPLQQQETGDGLLWSGCYLASQAWRYLTNSAPDALTNWTRVLDGLILAHDIPQDDTTYARSVRPHQADVGGDWVQGKPPYDAYDWLTGGNNDMIQGLFYGYAISWIHLPNTPDYDDYRQKIAARAARLADSSSVARDGGFNEMKATLLACLTTGDSSYLARYNEIWSNVEYRLWLGVGDGMFYVWGVSDWSGQHLDTVGNIIMQLLLSQTGADGGNEVTSGWVNGMRLNGTTGQVLWPIAAYSFAAPPSTLDSVRDWAIWGLREMPYPKQNFAIDQEINPAWCMSPVPSLFWKFDWMDGGRLQGLYGNPMFMRDIGDSYFNGNPFTVSSGESDWQSGGGGDFLHAYWLGRYFGVISAQE